MQSPPRDSIGVVPHDHPGIVSEDILVRYLHSSWVESEGAGWRISSAAFTPSTPPGDPRSSVSVDVKKLLVGEGKVSPFNAKAGQGFAELVTGDVRTLGFKVGWDPEPENQAHAGIWGIGKSQSKRRQLSRNCAVVILPP